MLELPVIERRPFRRIRGRRRNLLHTDQLEELSQKLRHLPRREVPRRCIELETTRRTQHYLRSSSAIGTTVNCVRCRHCYFEPAVAARYCPSGTARRRCTAKLLPILADTCKKYKIDRPIQ